MARKFRHEHTRVLSDNVVMMIITFFVVVVHLEARFDHWASIHNPIQLIVDIFHRIVLFRIKTSNIVEAAESESETMQVYVLCEGTLVSCKVRERHAMFISHTHTSPLVWCGWEEAFLSILRVLIVLYMIHRFQFFDTGSVQVIG